MFQSKRTFAACAYILLNGLVACSSPTDGTGSQSNKLASVGTNYPVTSTADPSTLTGANETSSTFFFAPNPFGMIDVSYIVSYNTFTGIGWATSSDFGATWTQHSSMNPGAIAPITTSVGVFDKWDGDTWVASPSVTNFVFLSSLVKSASPVGSDVGLALSSDAGNSFGNAVRVTDVGTGGGQPDVDAPVVATSPQNAKAYVWWHQGSKSWLRPDRSPRNYRRFLGAERNRHRFGIFDRAGKLSDHDDLADVS
jgi:hypothetical protein